MTATLPNVTRRRTSGHKRLTVEPKLHHKIAIEARRRQVTIAELVHRCLCRDLDVDPEQMVGPPDAASA